MSWPTNFPNFYSMPSGHQERMQVGRVPTKLKKLWALIISLFRYKEYSLFLQRVGIWFYDPIAIKLIRNK